MGNGGGEGGSGGDVIPTTLREEETAQLLPHAETTGKHTSSISLNPHLSHGDVREFFITYFRKKSSDFYQKSYDFL